MRWIIDLLIDKLKKEKQEEFEPIPLYIEDEWPEYNDNREEKQDKDDQNVIVIDL